MNTVKNHITILLRLIKIGVLEVAILLMTYLIKYVFQMKQNFLNLHVFNMITEIKELRTLTKHISCKCECEFDARKFKLNQKWNNNKCRCECKNLRKHLVCKKSYFLNPATCSCENGIYTRSIVNSAVICDKVIDTTKIIPTKIIPTKSTSTKTI